jgi:hypothetical protein
MIDPVEEGSAQKTRRGEEDFGGERGDETGDGIGLTWPFLE